jgi:hypothetical protein
MAFVPQAFAGGPAARAAFVRLEPDPPRLKRL